MRDFEFRARSGDGELVSDVLRANSEAQARRILQSDYAVVISLKALSDSRVQVKVPRKEVSFWLRQLATLLNAGVTIMQSLELSASHDSESLREAMTLVRYDVAQGIALSTALARNTNLLGATELALIRAGEESGKLALILLRLSDDVEKQQHWKNRLYSAATYPVFVLFFGAALFWLFVSWVIPAMSAVLEQLGVDLPWLTRLTIGVSDSLSNKIHVSLVAIFLATSFIAAKLAWRRHLSVLKPLLFRLLEAIPYVGSVFSRLEQARLLISFSAMLDSGLHINETVLLLRQVPKHPDRRHALNTVYEEVMCGTSTSKALETARLFEPVVTHVLVAGEEVGELALMARHSARILEMELEQDIETLIVVVEPLLMALIGGVALFFVVAAFLPLVQVLGSFVNGV
jgi:general secretion pathway protein F